jgi:hypothetical protein
MLTAEKPTAAIVLSIIGGIFVLLFGLFLALVGALLTFFALGVRAIFGLWGVLCGSVMILGGAMMNSRPEQHTAWGAIVLIFSILSLGSLGGLGLGFVLGLIGGALGIAWKPVATGLRSASPRICPNCGRSIDPSVRFCPSCGKQVSV